MDILKKNFFELFNIDIAVDINKSELDEKVKALQIKFHPDKFASGSDVEKRLALQLSSHINDGYKIFGTRKDPLGNGIGSYCWKQGVGVEEKNHLNACAAAMVKQLEASTHGVEKQSSESNTMKFI